MSGLALVLGLAHEPPVAGVIRQLRRMGQPHVVVDQRRMLGGGCRTWAAGPATGGFIDVDATRVDLADVTGVYTRLVPWAELPEVVAQPGLLAHARRLHTALDAWLETSAARVVNRPSANDTNNSKPYQAMIIHDHFDIPATLVTNDPQAAVAFHDEFGALVYKSVSGERSLVTMFGDADRARLPLLTNAPVQFQEHIPGVDVRVHVVGQEVFATRVASDAIDYRCDAASTVGMRPAVLSEQVAGGCIALTARLGLELSGIDLRYAADGRVVCFEVNPSPAYNVYEDATGQPIAAAIARGLW